MAEETIRIGQIVGAWGLKGHVKVDPMTDFLERFDEGREVLLKGRWVEIETFTVQKNRPVLKLKGVDTATQAEALQWEYLEGRDDEEFEMDEDEYFTQDLLGLRVITVDGQELGTVDEVHRYPAHDVIEVAEVLIPAVKQFIKEVDIEGGVITVELIPGMLGEE